LRVETARGLEVERVPDSGVVERGPFHIRSACHLDDELGVRRQAGEGVREPPPSGKTTVVSVSTMNWNKIGLPLAFVAAPVDPPCAA
jgi:hypothetical protein